MAVLILFPVSYGISAHMIFVHGKKASVKNIQSLLVTEDHVSDLCTPSPFLTVLQHYGS
jgi:hypothetical protein